jgi:choline monooxygenase
MDTNMVIPTSPSTCTVVYDYFLEKETLQSLGEEADTFLSTSLAASDQVQQEDNMICQSVQVGLHSSAYDTGRYAPGVEMADHAFHQTLARQLREKLGQA